MLFIELSTSRCVLAMPFLNLSEPAYGVRFAGIHNK
jgi:hypothetical protein